MLKTEYGKNFSNIKEIEKLEAGKYEVIGEINYLTQIEERRPHLVSYNKETNKATTNRPEALQEYINSFKNLKNYKLIFIRF